MADSVDRYKKIDLEVALEEYLRAHWGSLSQDPKVAPFFAGVDPLSPVKREPGSVEEKVKRPRRQTLKAREDLEAP